MTASASDRIPEAALAWHRDGRGAALATVVETWGSAPRGTGSQLAVSGGGEIMGSVSGGCVEGAVVVEALEALEDGRPRLLEFGVSDEDAFAVGLACGGRIRVLVDPVGEGALPPGLLADLAAARAERRSVAMLHRFAEAPEPGPVNLVERRLVGPETAPVAFESDRSGFLPEDTAAFIGLHAAPLRLAIIGAVHIAQHLAPMAREAGYAVTLIDPRETFAAAARFPGETVVEDWPDEALATHGLDTRTAVATLTHDPKLDDPALRAALSAPVFYIGALGSTRTHAKRAARLAADGFGAEAIARIDAPIGQDIGARTPAEIAVATLAQMTERLRRPASRPGRAVAA